MTESIGKMCAANNKFAIVLVNEATIVTKQQQVQFGIDTEITTLLLNFNLSIQ